MKRIIFIIIIIIMLLVPVQGFSQKAVTVVPMTPMEKWTWEMKAASEGLIMYKAMSEVVRENYIKEQKEKQKILNARIKAEGKFYFEKDWLKQAQSFKYSANDLRCTLGDRTNMNHTDVRSTREYFNNLVVNLSDHPGSPVQRLPKVDNYVKKAYMAKRILVAIDMMNNDPQIMPGYKDRYGDALTALKQDMEVVYMSNRAKVHDLIVRAKIDDVDIPAMRQASHYK